ncbi:hypothetical protein GLYMA_12G098200v4 [Glycine max]|nr:hypothetical protein GLYMA_12G098200v4 [Glycine max]KAG4385456.1 hypothetical protein GLYMA_12G098200v4 [Glycine max]KAH1142456.1 hypothetical protein GYH30_033241 [Glycine max]KAH1142458.1 hypothetical protein GYH30_033241 [Glycine max]
MVVNLSPSPPLHSSSIIRLANSKSPISEPWLRLKTHFPKPLLSPSFASPSVNFTCKKQFLHGNSRNVLDFRTWSIAGFDYGNFEGPQSVLEAAAVLTAIIVVHESGHFLAASLQGIHVILSVGLPEQEVFPGVVVPDVRAFSAASRDGLVPGDVILEVNGSEFSKPGPSAVSEVVDVIKRNPKRYVLLKIKRGEQNFDIRVTPDENFDGTGKIGVQLAPNVKIAKVRPKNLVQAVEFTGQEFWGLASNVLDGLKQTFLNFSQSASKVSGPVAIIAVGAEVARSNIDGLFQFAAILNINLAVINLLPLPALDGGTLALILIEAARGGRKLPLEVEQTIMSSGIMLVIILGLFLIVRDTLNLDFIKDLL